MLLAKSFSHPFGVVRHKYIISYKTKNVHTSLALQTLAFVNGAS
jgi:hypothetical protein